MDVRYAIIEQLRRLSERRYPSVALRMASNGRRRLEDILDRSGRRERRIAALGDVQLTDTVNQETNHGWVSAGRYAPFPAAPMGRHDLLAGLHRVVRPKHYFEIGVFRGAGLALANTRAIGVDPEPVLSYDLGPEVCVRRETSDEFFSRPDAFEHFGGEPVDLAFIDGMHLAEFALRDFINLEKQMSPAGVVLFDDMLPRNALEAYRIRRTLWWAGDVYKVIEILQKHRPDLVVLPVNTNPTGTLLVAGCDPSSQILSSLYPQLEEYCTRPDPQIVDRKWTHRTTAVDPRELLASPAWTIFRGVREGHRHPDDLKTALDQLRSLRPMR